ncbi:MAG TPA: transcriptional repressor LexA [Myxococcales bacterium]|jgi:repressor LexA|nr:transcriptional repressor LexA [Myxococcales bacterium]
MAEPLTERQQKILSFIKRSIQEQGYPPTIREIGEAFGIRSTNGVNDHLKALERKGYLLRGELKSRALSVIEGGMPGPQHGGRFPSLSPGRKPQLAAVPETGQVVEVPVIGKVAAGAPILAQENVTDHVRIDSFLLGDPATARKVFALKVAGDSMIGDGILDGDYIFVRKQLQATPGEIVVALIEDEATVKRYYPEVDRIRFQPSNPRLEPIYVNRDDFRETQIIGVVVGVYRRVH